MPSLVSLEKTISFGLTEPENGSDASGLRTTAEKVDKGYLLSGTKRWIGNATVADYIIVWARNVSSGGKIQGFVVTKGSQGLRTEKIPFKMATRMGQNAMVYLDRVFVPDDMRLAKADDFQSGTAAMLRSSRLLVAFQAVGVMAGAYETALQYCLKRTQFG